MLRLLALLSVVCLTMGTAIGATKTGDKIVGGSVADIVNYPYQVSFMLENEHSCGASIISKDWVLSAAHCCDEPNLRLLKMSVGNSKWRRGTRHTVEKQILHPKYVVGQNDYDICLLKVKKPFVFGSRVAKIALPTQDKAVPVGINCTVTGWGVTAYNGVISPVLKVAWVPIVSAESCTESYSVSSITPRMICAGYAEGGMDSCQNDSGGPLAYENELLGVVSFGGVCGAANQPGVYANVADPELRSWIKTVSDV